MFWYQCRYCKDNFDQWGKLVTHRRDEHRTEFEALKRRSALLLQNREETTCIIDSNREYCNVDSVRPSRKMKPSGASDSVLHQMLSPPRRRNRACIKEVDLENHEISLCVPSLSSPVRSPAIPPFSFPTPSPSPRSSRSGTPAKRRRTDCSPSKKSSTTDSVPTSFLSTTPPPTPSRSSSSDTRTPTKEELSRSLLPKIVHYDAILEDEELEISRVPVVVDTSCISVTKHFPVEKSQQRDRELAPVVQNGTDTSTDYPPTYFAQLRAGSQVIIENLDHREFIMSCSNPDNTLVSSRRMRVRSHRVALASLRKRKCIEMLKRTGQRLQRLHAQLRQGQSRSLFGKNFPSTKISVPSKPEACNGVQPVKTPIKETGVQKKLPSSKNKNKPFVGVQKNCTSRASFKKAQKVKNARN